jgi:hypothetical protein
MMTTMKRALPILAGLALLLAGGVVHGVWTGRWHHSGELARAAELLAALPDEVGDWKGKPYEQDAEALEIAGAVAHYSRAFTDPASGESVLVMLLAGKPSRMSVHRPEDCYGAAGYAVAAAPIKLTVTPAGQPGAEMWTGLFSRDDPGQGTSQLRIFWTWCGTGGRWEAPESPRWAFARRPVLYKLYVIRTAGDQTPLHADPCVRLLGQLLPILNEALAARD